MPQHDPAPDRHEVVTIELRVPVAAFLLDDLDAWGSISDLAWHAMWDALEARCSPEHGTRPH